MTDDELAAMGLLDPAADDPRRGEFLRRCLEIGLTVEELQAADDVMRVAVDVIYRSGDEQLTFAEAAARAGFDAPTAAALARATGFRGPAGEERVWDTDDVESLAVLRAAIDLLGEDALLQVLRVSTAAIGRIGDAVISAFLTSAGARATVDDQSGLALLEANLAGRELLREFGPWMVRTLTRYLRISYRDTDDAVMATAYADGVDTPVLTVGFADLVGSTSHTERRSLVELDAALERFEATAVDVVAELGGRIVKFMGDEVMFRAADPTTAAMIAVRLAEAVRDDPDLPPLRAGLAHGMVLSREGDFFGPTVNTAARVLKLAPMNGVATTLATADLVDAGAGIAVDPLGAIEMPGMAEPVELASLRRA